jgi:hypothetical protein
MGSIGDLEFGVGIGGADTYKSTCTNKEGLVPMNDKLKLEVPI